MMAWVSKFLGLFFVFACQSNYYMTKVFLAHVGLILANQVLNSVVLQIGRGLGVVM